MSSKRIWQEGARFQHTVPFQVTLDLTTQQLNQLQHAMLGKFVLPEYDMIRFALR